MSERLIITADCGFGREELSRHIAFYKCVAPVQGTNMVRRELGLREVEVRVADPRFPLYARRNARLCPWRGNWAARPARATALGNGCPT